MASYTLSPVGGAGAQFFDNNGNPLSGGKIYTYDAGTTNPQATWTNPGGTAANPNPIVLDSAGRPPQEIWLSVAFSYKFVIETSNGVLIKTYDNIPGLPPPAIVNDASSISYEQGSVVNAGSFEIGKTYMIASLGTTDFVAIGAAYNSTGQVFVATGAGSGTGTAYNSRTVESRLRDTLSVKDFGAVGDGVADDTAAVQAAINAANGIKTVFFPAGVYVLSDTLDVNVAGMTLTGERNNFTYGVNPQPVELRWTAGAVGINTYVPPNSATSGANPAYITLENLTINGNGVAQIGVDGGFVLTMQNCAVINCTTASLRLGVGSQTSKYYNCGFNGSLDGVLSLGGGTHYFYDCVLRQNTRYGFNGEMTNSSFYNCIFESNASYGVNLTGNCDMMLFSHCYYEQNDAAAGSNGYHVYVNQTVDTIRMPQIKFDTTVFGSIGVTKVANVQSGGVLFDNCNNVGDPLRDIINVADGAFVRVNESFLSSSGLLPSGAGVAPKVFYDPAKALICENVAGRVVLNSTGVTLGAGDFSVSVVCSFDNAASNVRAILNGDANSFAMVMTGSAEGVSTLNWGATGGTLTGRSVKTSMAPDIPIHIAYVRESGAYKVYVNGQKIAQGTDATNYSGAIRSFGGNGVNARMDGRIYAAKIYSGALTFDEVWSLCKNGGNYVGTGAATELISLEFENRIPGIIYETVGQENLQNFGSWAVTTSDAADFTPVVFGGSSAGIGTYDYQYGSYRVFDGYCYFQLSVKWTAHTGTGSMKISGLPFTSRNLAGFASTFATYSNDITFPAGATSIAAYIGSNDTNIELRGDGNALAATAVAMDTSGTLFVSGHYQIQVA